MFEALVGVATALKIVRPYNLMCKDEQFLKVNHIWVYEKGLLFRIIDLNTIHTKGIPYD